MLKQVLFNRKVETRASFFTREECKTSFSDGNANNYPTIQILTLLTRAIDPKRFIWSKQYLLPTRKAIFQNVLQKHDHKNVLTSNFHRLQTNVLGSEYFHVKVNKCFLFLWECACYFCIHLSGMWPPALSLMRCVCVCASQNLINTHWDAWQW